MAVKKSNSNNRKRKKATVKGKQKAAKKLFSNNLVIGVILIVIGLFSAYAYIDFSAGVVGNAVRQGFSYCFGTSSLFVSIYLFVLGVLFCLNKIDDWARNFVLIFILLINTMIAFSINIPNFLDYSVLQLFSLAKYGQYGGIIGILLSALFIKLFSASGTVLMILLSSIMIFVIIFKNGLQKHWSNIKEKNKNAPSVKDRIAEKVEIIKDRNRIKREIKATKDRSSETTMIPPISDLINDGSLFEPLQINENKSLFESEPKTEENPKNKIIRDPFGFIEEEIELKNGKPIKINENYLHPIEPMDELENDKTDKSNKSMDSLSSGRINPSNEPLAGLTNGKFNSSSEETKELDHEEINIEELPQEYVFPSMDLLNPPAIKKKSKKDDVLKKAKIIEETLKNFGVKAKII